MIKLVQTCGACPEQYNAYIGEECIGSLHLRHSFFRAEYKGTVVYCADTRGDGCFEDDERDEHLTKACNAIIAQHIVQGQPVYTIESKADETQNTTPERSG